MRYEELSQYLKTMRVKAGITQAQIANTLGYTSPQFVSNWERGLALPPLKALRLLVDVLDLNREKVIRLYLLQSRRDLERVLGGRARRA